MTEENFDPAETFDSHTALLRTQQAAERYGDGPLLDAINGLPNARGQDELTEMIWTPKVSKPRGQPNVRVWVHTWKCRYGTIRVSQVTGRPLLTHINNTMARLVGYNQQRNDWAAREQTRREAATQAGIPVGWGTELPPDLVDLGVASITPGAEGHVGVSIRVNSMNYYQSVPFGDWDYFVESLPQLFWHMSEGVDLMTVERD